MQMSQVPVRQEGVKGMTRLFLSASTLASSSLTVERTRPVKAGQACAEQCRASQTAMMTWQYCVTICACDNTSP